ncbi:MAG: hypothetical protein LIP01_14275 [Tannerellaceae bacterium]|nr:hypothetical protein [Tannerellaceae bacterium]
MAIQPEENARLIIHCRDLAFPATLSRKNNVFTTKTDAAALKKIWGEYTLVPKVGASDIEHPELIQYYSSDWDFTLARADANGWVVITDKDKITIDKPKVSATPVLTLTYGIDLIEFNGTLQGDGQVAEVQAWAWDCSQQKLIQATAQKPSLNDQGEDTPDRWAEEIGDKSYALQTGTCSDKAVLQAWVDAKRLKTGLSRVSGTCLARETKMLYLVH